MSKNILYCFVVDEALRNPQKLDTSPAKQSYGILDYETANYLVNRGILGDNRRNRLAILNNQYPRGQMSLWFDQNKFEMPILENLSDVEQTLLFNIVERIYLQQEFTDDNLEYQLTNSGSYAGYVPNSYMRSTSEVSTTIYDVNGDSKDIPIYYWYAFDFSVRDVVFTVHFWVYSTAFASEYPFVTITSVIPPYDPNILVNPVSLIQSLNAEVLVTGSSFIFDKTNVETLTRDQNGVYKYVTKYKMDTNRVLELPFALPYCGPKEPDSLSCRKAIREYLEETTGLSKNVIVEFFPELYIGSRFYIVPLWDMYTDYPDRDIYHSIFNFNQIAETAQLIYSNEDIDFVNQNLELLTNAHNKMISMSLPDELNEEYFSILTQHPTYQDYSSQVPGWKYMDADTQEFAGKLNRCMSVLHGDTLSSEFIRVEYNSNYYLSFVSGKSEYLIMEKESYLNTLSNFKKL